MKIKAYVSYRNDDKTHFYKKFNVIEKLPEINSKYYEDDFTIEIIEQINEIELDCEQSNNDVFNYDLYELVILHKEKEDEYEEYKMYEYVCIRKLDVE